MRQVRVQNPNVRRTGLKHKYIELQFTDNIILGPRRTIRFSDGFS